jgi:hypothetical protein
MKALSRRKETRLVDSDSDEHVIVFYKERMVDIICPKRNKQKEESAAMSDSSEVLGKYLQTENRRPLFILGDCLKILASFPPNCIDCSMTSPPYWGQREYLNGGIGLEETYDEYVGKLLAVAAEVKRVLKPTGSFWLNLGDAYQRKSLVGIP